MPLTIAVVLGLFILGACVGSFTSVVIYRLHSRLPGILTGRSKCTTCETQLQMTDLIPVLSYLTLRGKCRYCSKSISYMYPLLEIVSGAFFAALFFKFPFINTVTLQFSEAMVGLYLLYAVYAFVLLFTFFFDLHYMKVADEILLPAILLGLIATIAAPLTPFLVDAVIGLCIAVGFFGIQILLSKGKWVGMGDLRVGAFMGVILGWKLTIVALFVSYVLGSVVALIVALHRKKIIGIKIPFAPLLVTGTVITMFFGEKILTWYLTSLGL
ncbi:MAG: Type 4 prepilin-like protein leader peptide-processing enzyme [Candidatus Peregrinibacteria bacterium GW2011_GWA2_47_7]|nr:MAG: Type 4 prepilin-like protein leader peptide-processing enzyme [Candidatus Peregrinibacteria bacterium GW2011_GWA2_47_7]